MITLEISFVLNGGIDRRIDRGVMVVSFLYWYYGGMQANGIMHEGEIDRCGRRYND